MEQNHQHQPSAQHQVVANLKTPAVKASGGQVARFNAFALSFAAFFGVMAIFAAIAGFTDGEWSFNIPLLGVLFANTGIVPTMFIATLLAVAFSIIGVLSINKITDADALKKSWQCVAKVFCALGIIYTVSMLAVALYPLMGAGKKSGLSHEDLWLSCFLPNLIMALTAGGMFFLARAIANGKTALLRILGIVSVIVAGIGLVLVVIQTLVNFYGETKSNSIYDYDWSDLWDY